MEEIRSGRLFEMGPDGYGYLLDDTQPERSYAFHTSMLEGSVSDSPTALEDREVSFTLVQGRPDRIRLIDRPTGKKMMGVGT